MDLTPYSSSLTTGAIPTTPRPSGHIWSTRLASWVVPITQLARPPALA
jgi:hypothetical protein